MDFPTQARTVQKTLMASILLLLVLLMPALQITGHIGEGRFEHRTSDARVTTLNYLSAQSVGVCYGRNGNNLPSETEVVDLYKSHGIGRMRIYEPNDPTYQALKGSNIELTVTILNDKLQGLTNAAAATDWIQKNVLAFPDVKFKYIAVGNEVQPTDPQSQYLLPAIQNIHNAIVAANLQGQIKVSTAIYTTLVDNAYPPSAGKYSDAAKSFITPVINFLASNGAPLLVNVYPYFSYTENPAQIELAYALFTSQGITTPDGVKYHNLFDALLDAQYSALEKANASNVEIVVSESGWPSKGGYAATPQNAQTFYQNLINHVTGTSGTPKRPGKAIETYLFAMFDENIKAGSEVERHFGIFNPTKIVQCARCMDAPIMWAIG
ncbi:unnamed protein product [Prunus armeniaca]|uniref:glucan endo-1,3-beta-D-glucosidase n=1 Tax=Prunus armeniaca TaxID=36596 RepID=A0A6J5UP95_PRUAR|nr:unnamed protein product [Prunus armeniaca]